MGRVHLSLAEQPLGLLSVLMLLLSQKHHHDQSHSDSSQYRPHTFSFLQLNAAKIFEDSAQTKEAVNKANTQPGENTLIVENDCVGMTKRSYENQFSFYPLHISDEN